jgi:zinc protease
LPGGLKLALLPKKTRGATVNAYLALHFGDAQSLQGKDAAATLTGAMLSRGTQTLTRQQMEDEFDRLKARVAINGTADMAMASVQTTRDNLAAVLKLAAESLRRPSFPAAEFAQLKREMQADIEAQMREPQGIGGKTFRRHFNIFPKGDPRYVASFEEQLAELSSATLDDVKRFHQAFYGASNAELAVVGDFDAKEIATLASELLGDWKSPGKFERLAKSYRDIAPIDQSIETPDKANAFFVAGETLKLRDDDPDYPALTLGNYMLGGGFLNSRLATRIRQKEGLSYTVGSQLSADALDESGSFTGYAIYAPQNRDKLEAAFKGEIARALKDGFTAEEVAAAKAGFLQSRQLARAQDGAVAATLVSNLFIGRTYQWSAEFERKIAALTPRAVLEAMDRHIDASRLSFVKAGDFIAKQKP